MRRPNVVLLYTDQQRWDALRCAGNPDIHTPNLDALAAQGALLTDAYCPSPVCMPSRHSLLSGQYPSAIGSTCNGIEMREDVLTLHEVLKPYGYHTANIGKLHFRNHAARDHREPHPTCGFDELVLSDEPGCYDDAYVKWVEERDASQVENCRCTSPPAVSGAGFGPPWERIEKHPRETHRPYVFEGPEDMTHTAFVAEETADYIRRRAGAPFFVIAGFYAPHAPLNPPQRFVDMYDPSTLPPPAMNEGENRLGLSEDEWKRVKAFYYALVTHIDDQIGRILNALDDAGVRDNTLVIFTSDHGEHLGDHGQVGKGAPGCESSAHVPLIVSLPERVAAGQVRHELIEGVDVAPTILDWCGVQVPPAMQGRSFRALLEGGEYEPRTSALFELKMPFQVSWKTIRTERFKYGLCSNGSEVLFDLIEDPNELSNLAGQAEHDKALAEVRAELLRRWFDAERQYPLRTGAY